MLGAQIRHHLRDLRIGQRVAEGRHLLPAVENLIGDPGRGPELVLADIGQIRPLLAAASAGAVAVSAALALKQDSAGLFIGPGLSAAEGIGRQCG